MLLAFIILAGCVIWILASVFQAGPSSEQQLFYIASGKSSGQIYEQLVSNHLIDDTFVGRAAFKLYTFSKDVQAGEYILPAYVSLGRLLDILWSGKFYLRRLTIPEGLTVQQALQRIENSPYLVGELGDKLVEEGSLLADTIYYVRGMSKQKMIDRLILGQSNLLEKIWKDRDPEIALKDKQELLILASIVEKESGIAEEQPKIAAVFFNRLRKGMRLQADSTVLYGLFGGAGRPSERHLYKSDLKKPTPYNTYIISGLPPTPISNPGRTALYAVAHPAHTDDLYFVAKAGGGHAFARELADHNVNVRNWRKFKDSPTHTE